MEAVEVRQVVEKLISSVWAFSTLKVTLTTKYPLSFIFQIESQLMSIAKNVLKRRQQKWRESGEKAGSG